MRQFYRLVESLAHSVMMSLNEGRDDDGEYVDDTNSDITMSTAWGFDIPDDEGDADDDMLNAGDDEDVKDTKGTKVDTASGKRLDQMKDDVIELAYEIFDYVRIFGDQALSVSMNKNNLSDTENAFGAASKDNASMYADIRNLAFKCALNFAVYIWKSHNGGLDHFKWEAMRDSILENLFGALTDVFALVKQSNVERVSPRLFGRNNGAGMSDDEKARAMKTAKAKTVAVSFMLKNDKDGEEMPSSLYDIVMRMLSNLAHRACDNARADKLVKGGDGIKRSRNKVYNPTGLEDVDGLSDEQKDFVYLGFVKELLNLIRNKNGDSGKWRELYEDTRFFMKGKDNTQSQWRKMQLWMDDFASKYPNHPENKEYQEKLHTAIERIFDGKDADQKDVKGLFSAIKRNVNDMFAVLRRRKPGMMDTDTFERENMPAPQVVNEIRQMVSDKIYSLNEDDRRHVVEAILSEGKKKRRHSYTKEEEKLSKKSNTRAKKDAQSILSKKAVNASAIARQCRSLKHMSDDGRRSFISKIERGEVTPDDTLASEIENAFTNLYSN